MTLSTEAVIEVGKVQADPAIGTEVSFGELEPLIETVSIQIDDYLDKFVVQRTRTERRLLGQRTRNRFRSEHRSFLDKRPVVSITSIKDDASPTPNELKIKEDFYLHNERGSIESLHVGGFPEPVGFWNIIYVTGLYANRATVDHRVRRAAIKLIVAHRSRPDPSVTRERIGSLDVQYGTSGGSSSEGAIAELPPDVRVLLDTAAQVAV